MNAKRFFVNPLDFKWSGTRKLTAYVEPQAGEMIAAIKPVLIVADTPEARKALKFEPAKP